MSATQQANHAYHMQARAIGTARGLEYDTLARITRQLRLAADQRSIAIGPLASAIYDNRRLWTIFATEAADEANPLPVSLRARVLSLAEFTRQHSGRVLRTAAPVDPLIDINLAVMRGLSGQAGTQ